MNHTDSHAAKNLKKNKDAGKSPQELYDKHIRKGDEAIISEDIILAEKHYQHADHYLRCLNDSNHCGNILEALYSASPRPMETLIEKALKGIAAERAARKEALLEKVREAARAVKAARSEKKDKAMKSKADRGKLTGQIAGGQKAADKKLKNADEPCKIIPLNSTVPCAGIEQQT